MVNTDGVVKLADFGIAKAAEQSDITKVGSVLGTAAYLSPEQARGEPAGPASDLYALGVVSYQLMAGKLPYEAASLTDLARLQESGPPPRAATRSPRRPAGAGRRGRARAGARSRRAATQDAAEMEDALRDGLAGVGATERPGLDARAARPRTRPGCSRRPRAAPARPRAALQPVDEPPRRPPPAARAASRPAAAPRERRAGQVGRARARDPADRGRRVRLPADDSGGGDQQVQLNEDVGGSVDDAVGSFKQLVEDNTQ